LRVFAAVRHSSDPSHYHGGLWSTNFYPALRKLGHEIVESKVDLLPTSRFMDIPSGFTPEESEARVRATQQILDEVRTVHRPTPISLFLSYFYNAHFDPDGFDELRRLGIPSVNFFCNSIYQFGLVGAVAAKVDFAWHTEKHARPSYLAAGANPIWVQMGADPEVYAPRPSPVRVNKACFVGQRYADRDRWVAAIIKADLPIDIYGAGWSQPDPATPYALAGPDAAPVYLGRRRPPPGSRESYLTALRETLRRDGPLRGSSRILRQLFYQRKSRKLQALVRPFARGYLPFERIIDVFSGYALSLNFSNVWSDGRPGSRLVPHIRLRDFEAPMAGACYLTGYSDELEDFYDIGREVDTYRNADELIDKARFYLANGGPAERLRAAGHARARRDHTWTRRFELLFEKLALQT
jgi:spore maturation protein CgeB